MSKRLVKERLRHPRCGETYKKECKYRAAGEERINMIIYFTILWLRNSQFLWKSTNFCQIWNIILFFFVSLRHINLIQMACKDLNRLKVVLAEKKRTNKWLAEQLGKDQGTISKWCTNTSQPDMETLARISSY